MSDVWDDLKVLLRRGATPPALTAEAKLDLLAQVVANLLDEVEILKRHARKTSSLTPEEWDEQYRKHRLWLLFSAAGPFGECVEKYRSYLRTRHETAAVLVPDRAEREAQIEALGILT